MFMNFDGLGNGENPNKKILRQNLGMCYYYLLF